MNDAIQKLNDKTNLSQAEIEAKAKANQVARVMAWNRCGSGCEQAPDWVPRQV